MEASYAQSIIDELISGNFSRAAQLAAHELKNMPAYTGLTTTPERSIAEEAYKITRYLLHRSERLANMPVGMDKGRAYQEILVDLSQVP
ncbi:MAG TPA: hypothetical protein PLY93_14850, partial [Turneriella sp.]|nr:hypothetical protein [Turneriella sp.]